MASLAEPLVRDTDAGSVFVGESRTEMGRDAPWTLLRTGALSEAIFYFEVTLGDKEDQNRAPICVFGFSHDEYPKLGHSSAFNQLWPGTGLRGVEAHVCGDIIGWDGHNPIKGRTSLFTFVKGNYFPGDKVQLVLTGAGQTHVFINRSFKYTFDERMDRSERVYFHLYIKGKHDPKDVHIHCKACTKQDDFHICNSSLLEWTAWPLPVVGKTFGKQSLFEKITKAEVMKQNLPSLVSSLTSAHTDRIFGVCPSPDGMFVTTVSADNSLKIWHAQTGKCEFTIQSGLGIDAPASKTRVFSGYQGGEKVSFASVACFQDDLVVEGSWSMATGRGNGTVDVWTVLPSYVVGTLAFKDRVRHSWTAEHDIGQFTRGFGVTSLGFDLRNRALITTGGQTTKKFNVTLSEDLHHAPLAMQMSFAARGAPTTNLTVSGCTTVGLTLKQAWSEPVGARQLAYSPNFLNFALATGQTKEVQIRDAGNGKLLHTICHHFDVNTVYLAVNELAFGDTKGHVLFYDHWPTLPGTVDLRPPAEKARPRLRWKEYADDLKDRGAPMPKLFSGHVELTIWHIRIFTAMRDDKPTRFVLAASGSGQVKVWEAGERMDDEAGHRCIVTVFAQDGAVSAVHMLAGACASLNEELFLEHQKIKLSAVVYTGGFEATANRWNLTSQLAAGLNHVINKPQQQFKNPSILDVMKVPCSWFLTLFIIIKGFYQDHAESQLGHHPHPLIPFWPRYMCCVLAAYTMIVIMGSDVLLHWKEKLNGMMSDGNIGNDCRKQRERHELEMKYLKVERVPYLVALFGLLTIFKQLLHVNDCAYIGRNLDLPYEGPDHKVLEVDPGMPCYTGLHMILFIHNCALIFFFLALTAPVYIVLGDLRRLQSDKEWPPLRRLWERMWVGNWCKDAESIWPNFAGPSSQRRYSYFFQVAFLFYQISVTSVQMLTTYNPHLRFTVDTGLGFVLLVCTFWRPPVQNPAFLLALRGVIFILCAYPFCLYIYQMHSELTEDREEISKLKHLRH